MVGWFITPFSKDLQYFFGGGGGVALVGVTIEAIGVKEATPETNP